jgi:antitoxin component HigA of HigAB toxin-antitoxin module
MAQRLEELDFPSRDLTPEEVALREILAALVEVYKKEHRQLPEQPPCEKVRYLMEQRELRQADLVPVLGTRAQVSDVVTGRRGISKAQARKLGRFLSGKRRTLHLKAQAPPEAGAGAVTYLRIPLGFRTCGGTSL